MGDRRTANRRRFLLTIAITKPESFYEYPIEFSLMLRRAKVKHGHLDSHVRRPILNNPMAAGVFQDRDNVRATIRALPWGRPVSVENERQWIGAARQCGCASTNPTS
jgi:hypothetical protein